MQGQAGSAEASQQMVAADTLGRTQQLIGVEVSGDDGNEFGPALSPDAVGDEQRLLQVLSVPTVIGHHTGDTFTIGEVEVPLQLVAH